MNIFDPAFGKRKRLRFTGENPPPEIWTEFPNWCLALGEEGEAGQDETTLMPHEEQSFIGEHTSFTGGSVRFHDARIYPALLEIGSEERIVGCQVYESTSPWRVYLDYPSKKWTAYSEDWLPQAQRSPVVSMADERIFPLEVRMHVPWKKSGRPTIYEISPDGSIREKRA
jgi:hypothetical protein